MLVKFKILFTVLVLLQIRLLAQEKFPVPIGPNSEVCIRKIQTYLESLKQYEVPEWFKNASQCRKY